MENQTENSSKSNKSLGFFIALFALSMALNVFLFFRYAKKGVALERENKEILAQLKNSNLHADSLQKELDFTIAELEQKLNENLAMNDIKDEYRAELEQKIVELKSAKQQISSLIASGGTEGTVASIGSLSAAQKEITRLKEENTKYIQQLDETQRLYVIARNAVDQYSMSTQEYKEAVDSVVRLYQALNESIEDERILRLSNLNISPYMIKKDVSSPTFKASKVSQLKISFNLRASKLVYSGEKDIVIRILGTSGEVLSDDVSQLTNSDELYSMKQSVPYVGKEHSVVLYFTQKAAYKSGKHSVQVLLDGVVLDSKDFILY